MVFYAACVSASERQNSFKHLILNYLDNIEWIDWCNCPVLLLSFLFLLSFVSLKLRMNRYFGDLFATFSTSIIDWHTCVKWLSNACESRAFFLSLSVSRSFAVIDSYFYWSYNKNNYGNKNRAQKKRKKNWIKSQNIVLIFCLMRWLHSIKTNTPSSPIRCLITFKCSDFMRRSLWLIV